MTTHNGLVTLADIQPESVAWMWPGRLPIGKLVVIDGDPATGKSTFALELAARVSTGTTWPDGALGFLGDVLVLSAEDGLADTIVPRLVAASADRTRVHALLSVPVETEDGSRKWAPPSLPRDITYMRRVIEGKDVKLVVIDVLMAYLNSAVDSHRDQDVRGVLAQLATVADETGCTIVLLRHLNKAGGSNPLYRGGGSIGIVGAARAAFLVARDPEDPNLRILACTKSNLAAEAPSLAYRLVDDPDNSCARVQWEKGPVHHTATSLLRVGSGERDEDRNDVDIWLGDLLTDGGLTSTEVYRAADAAGYSRDQAKRAKKRLGVVGAHPDIKGPWYWQMPDKGAPIEQGRGQIDPAPLAPLPAPLPLRCAVCGFPMTPALAAAGETTHATCCGDSDG